MAKQSLQEQVEHILMAAEKRGVTNNFFFVTTFKRYQVQMQILSSLEKEINENGPTVEKVYVKGRPNLTANPAIAEYNKTATAANGTVATLINIIKTLSDDDEKGGKLAELMSALNDE